MRHLVLVLALAGCGPKPAPAGPDYRNDNDRDGFPNKTDGCPDNPEVVNGIEDEDGCPDEAPLETEEPSTPEGTSPS